MAELEPKKSVAAQRSHEDAKSANALLQAAGQAAILINGGAATAILAFSAAEKAVVRITSGSLAASLGFFACGVIAGAFVIAFQATSVQRYAVHWEGIALGYADADISSAEKKGYTWGLAAQLTFIVGMIFFLFGALILANSLWRAEPAPVQACPSLPIFIRSSPVF